MIAEILGEDPWEVARRYTSDDIAYWMAYLKIKNDDGGGGPKRGVKKPVGKRKSLPRSRPRRK